MMVSGRGRRGTMRGDADVMTVEKWGVFEAEARGRSDGNPYLEGRVTGRFTGGCFSPMAGGTPWT